MLPFVMRVLVLQTAPGQALRESLLEWQKMPGIKLTINTFQLPESDCLWLQEAYPQILQIKFDPFDRAKLIDQVRQAEGYTMISMRINIPFPSELLEALSAPTLTQPLKVLGEAGSNVAHIDLAAATKQGVAVTCTPGANANGVAEFTLAQIFCLLRSVSEYNRFSHEGTWAKYLISPGEELSGKILGLVGFGPIAQALSFKARALGMKVMVYTRTPDKLMGLSEVEFVPDLATLLRLANIVSLHLPLTSSTQDLIGEKEIALMQKGSYLINTSRGGIIDENAVALELQKLDSKLSGVAFDVFKYEEEGRFRTPLQNCKNALLTPHVAGTTNTALTNAATQLVKNMQALWVQGR